MKFIHITDIHLVGPGALLHELNPAERFARCIDDINLNHSDAECCVITGDLADAGESMAYKLLQDEMARCNLPCHVLVGNHDLRDPAREQINSVQLDANGFVQSAVETSAGVFVLLDTLVAGDHYGEYCEARRSWLKTQLETHRGKSIFLFMHHPPFDIHLPCLDVIALRNQDEFAEIVRSSCDDIRHLFFGHAHRPLSGNWMGISYSSLRGTNHQVALDFDVPEIIYVDEPPEYAVVFVDDDRIVVHTHSYPL
ncbi:MAG: phosphodiesterase [Pseudomonadota bacterium]